MIRIYDILVLSRAYCYGIMCVIPYLWCNILFIYDKLLFQYEFGETCRDGQMCILVYFLI